MNIERAVQRGFFALFHIFYGGLFLFLVSEIVHYLIATPSWFIHSIIVGGLTSYIVGEFFAGWRET